MPFKVFRAFDLTVESTLLSQDPFNVNPGFLFLAIEESEFDFLAFTSCGYVIIT